MNHKTPVGYIFIPKLSSVSVCFLHVISLFMVFGVKLNLVGFVKNEYAYQTKHLRVCFWVSGGFYRAVNYAVFVLMSMLFLSEFILVSTKMMNRSGMGRVLTGAHMRSNLMFSQVLMFWGH